MAKKHVFGRMHHNMNQDWKTMIEKSSSKIYTDKEKLGCINIGNIGKEFQNGEVGTLFSHKTSIKIPRWLKN